jgi:cytochrome c-type biogenesis protein CcmH/NrfG
VDAPEREFLERSLDDLDRELAAGDLAPSDHARLRAAYERRLRGHPLPPRPRARPGFVVASVAFVVVVAVAAGVLLARSAGRREAGQTFTGNAPTAGSGTTAPADPGSTGSTLPADLARCTTLDGPDAIDCFTAYTQANPEDPDGFTQFGLFAISAGMANGSDQLFDAGETFIRRALEIDPADVTARVYLAVVLDRLGRAPEAVAECALLAGTEVPADLAPLVDLACQ